MTEQPPAVWCTECGGLYGEVPEGDYGCSCGNKQQAAELK